jgi:hypothetical protein
METAVRECVAEQQQLPPPQRPPNEVFAGYQLGDCLRFCMCPDWVVEEHPHSFTAKFKALACAGKDLDTFSEPRTYHHMLRIFAEVNGTAGFREPEPTSLVIHLRLGDMVEMAAADVQTMLIRGGEPPGGRFPNSIKSVPELLADAAVANVTTVHIVGGGCWRGSKPGDCIKSTIYAQCVFRAFEHQGYTTTLSVDGENADEDFYFMAHAKHFIETAGGFSRLASNLVERQGGTVYGRRFDIGFIGVKGRPHPV